VYVIWARFRLAR